MTEKGRVTAPVKLTKRARIIAAPVLVLVLALAVFAAHQLRRELTACFEWPDVELLVEDEPQPDYAYSEYYGGDRPFVNICTGADLLFRDKRGTDYYYVPSLEYIGMLFMPEYAHCVIRAPSDTEYLSISCSQGGLDKGPRSVSVYRLSIETAEKLPQHPWDDGTTLLPPAAYGTEVPLEKHGGSYCIYEPELDCVYVCRSVWDNGVAEHAWLVTEE